MPGILPRPSISVSNSPPGTGISSTWCGCSSSSASMSGGTAQKPWRTARIDLNLLWYKGAAAGPPFCLVPCPGCCAARRTLHRDTRAHCYLSPTRVGKGSRMSDHALPTLTQSALRGLACKCPRCGMGKLYAGFLTLRPRCESCGLDYAFSDTGDGPAIFIIILAGTIVVGCALI